MTVAPLRNEKELCS